MQPNVNLVTDTPRPNRPRHASVRRADDASSPMLEVIASSPTPEVIASSPALEVIAPSPIVATVEFDIAPPLTQLHFGETWPTRDLHSRSIFFHSTRPLSCSRPPLMTGDSSSSPPPPKPPTLTRRASCNHPWITARYHRIVSENTVAGERYW
jgi:hypothetical protein